MVASWVGGETTWWRGAGYRPMVSPLLRYFGEKTRCTTQTHPSKIKNLPLVSELFGSRKVCVLINAKHYAYPLKHSVTITWSATIGRRFNVVMVLLYNNDEPTYVTQYQQLKRFLTQRKQQGSASRKTKRLKCKETV